MSQPLVEFTFYAYSTTTTGVHNPTILLRLRDPMSDEQNKQPPRFTRRQILTTGVGTLALLGVGVAGTLRAGGCETVSDSPQADSEQTDDAPHQAPQHEWQSVRDQFDADDELIHMAGMLLATHPRPVREAIERHRQGLDDNPTEYLYDHWARSEAQFDDDGEQWAKEAAGRYLDVTPANVAITDSTTEGLAVVYNGLDIGAEQHALTGHWNHWATEGSLQHAAAKRGFSINNASLYDDVTAADADEITDRLIDAITPETRVVAVTWVHSTTGLKLPVAQIGERIDQINQDRSSANRILFCVDGVHGFGVEDIHFADLHCDFFIAGCHKWLFGPRGTGIVVGRPDAWNHATPTVPTFSLGITPGRRFTPGGFKPYEHIWALHEAFDFHLDIGKDRIQQRIHNLTDHLIDDIATMEHIQLRTPTDADLRSGIVSFRVDGYSAYDVVDALRGNNIIASVTPEDSPAARLAPGLLNDHDEVEQTLEALQQL